MTQCPTIPIRLAAGALLLIGIVSAAVMATRSGVREPELNGIPLSHFLDQQTYGELRTERDARESIRDFGTNAIPHLVAILDARESRLRVAMRELLSRQSFLRISLPPLFIRQRQAALACAELGPLATGASASLTRLVEDPLLCRHALGALAMIGPQSFPVLTNALASSNREARAEAAGVLRYMTPRHAPVDVLLSALTDPEPEVRANAAGSLSFLHCDLERVRPALMERLGDTNATVRITAVQSLGWLQADARPALAALRRLREQGVEPADEIKIDDAIRMIESAVNDEGGSR